MSETEQLEYEELEHDELPRRPRRRLLAPVPMTLLAVLLTASGFIGGVLVQKGQQSSTASGGAARSATAFATLRGARGASSPTIGEVANIDGGVLYVTDLQGNTVKVTVPNGLKVSKTVSTSARNIHPGETVVVQGNPNSDGSLTARSIGIGTSGGGLFGGGRGEASGSGATGAGAGRGTSAPSGSRPTVLFGG